MARWPGTYGHKASHSVCSLVPVLRKSLCPWSLSNRRQAAGCFSNGGIRHWLISGWCPLCKPANGTMCHRRQCGISGKASLCPTRHGGGSRLAARLQALPPSLGQSTYLHVKLQSSLNLFPWVQDTDVRKAMGCNLSAGWNNAGNTMKECWSNGVLTATTGTTFKLFLVCGFIGWLLSTGRLSDETAPVLSKVLLAMVQILPL